MYKRQNNGRGFGQELATAHGSHTDFNGTAVLALERNRAGFRIRANRFGVIRQQVGVKNMVPVSYTHLDVYKRQQLNKDDLRLTKTQKNRHDLQTQLKNLVS